MDIFGKRDLTSQEALLSVIVNCILNNSLSQVPSQHSAIPIYLRADTKAGLKKESHFNSNFRVRNKRQSRTGMLWKLAHNPEEPFPLTHLI